MFIKQSQPKGQPRKKAYFCPRNSTFIIENRRIKQTQETGERVWLMSIANSLISFRAHFLENFFRVHNWIAGSKEIAAFEWHWAHIRL